VGGDREVIDDDKRDPLDGPDEFYGWQPWAMATNELAAMRWLEAHDEDGHDYADDITQDCD
jgi:hypothetical protein